jgi:hypothetical protein
VVNRKSNTVNCLPGNGDLTFGSQVCFGADLDSGPVSHVDINDDGLPIGAGVHFVAPLDLPWSPRLS